MTWDQLHEEDVLFEFRGDQPDQLTPGRFYRGDVDGFADFGVFVELGDGVTGLLHRSQLDRRLESLDWGIGDEVVVQVDAVRDNGNVDLSWSIRQSSTEFRAEGVDDPTTDGDSPPEESGDQRNAAPPEPESPTETAEPATESAEATPDQDDAATEQPDTTGKEVTSPSPDERVTIEEAMNSINEGVRIEGRVTNVRQTSGPTIFEVTDESGVLDCAAFEAPGVRAYPDVEENDVVRLEGVVERHRESVQIEVDDLRILDGDAATAVSDRLESAVTEQARPTETTLLVEDDALAALSDELAEAATRLRRAAIEARPVVLRHPATVDGYVGAAAVERALGQAITDEHDEAQAADHLVTRRPMRESWYELGDAFYDVPDDADADDPIVLVVGAGATEQDVEALELLGVYGIDRIVLDTLAGTADTETPAEHVLVPTAAGEQSLTATTVAANLAAQTAPAIRPELFHLPAISYWGSTPEAYARIARDNGFDAATVSERREAIALVAYYQQYDDKRELVTDLLFDGDQAGDLASHVSQQYRQKVDTAIEIADANREAFSVTGGKVTLIDIEDLHHPREFPPVRLLLGELRARWEPGPEHAIVALAEDACFLAGPTVDLEALAEQLSESVDDAGIEARRDRITFLAGKRPEISAALIDAFAVAFDTPETEP